MSIIKLLGSVTSECSKHGHWKFEFVDETYHTKLEKIHDKLYPSKQVDKYGLIKPDLCTSTEVTIRKPYTKKEFIIKVGKSKWPYLPKVGSIIYIHVTPTQYNFQKNNIHYQGWNLILKQISSQSYVDDT